MKKKLCFRFHFFSFVFTGMLYPMILSLIFYLSGNRHRMILSFVFSLSGTLYLMIHSLMPIFKAKALTYYPILGVLLQQKALPYELLSCVLCAVPLEWKTLPSHYVVFSLMFSLREKLRLKCSPSEKP
jgi:hypothetical protein